MPEVIDYPPGANEWKAPKEEKQTWAQFGMGDKMANPDAGIIDPNADKTAAARTRSAQRNSGNK